MCQKNFIRVGRIRKNIFHEVLFFINILTYLGYLFSPRPFVIGMLLNKRGMCVCFLDSIDRMSYKSMHDQIVIGSNPFEVSASFAFLFSFSYLQDYHWNDVVCLLIWLSELHIIVLFFHFLYQINHNSVSFYF